jgi:hypothetical protein
VGRTGTFVAVCLSALAFASSAQAKPLLGITGDLPRFETLTGQASTVHQAFLGWGQGLTFGSPFVSLFGTLTPIPMIHIGTAKGVGSKETITPAQIAAGAGDGYLIALNQSIAQWGKGIYIRPMAEMNNYENPWSGFTKSGAAKPGHSPAAYRKAFARIYLIVHGGSAATINAKLESLGMPGISHDLAPNPYPRVRVVWSPLAGGNPRLAANDPQNYYPGRAYVDVDGGDIFEETLNDTAPWSYFEAIYKASVAHHRPFAVPEWGLLGVDDETFVQHMCTFLQTHAIEEAGYYDSRPNGIPDLEPKPKSKAAYRSCVTPLGSALPAWAAMSALPGLSTTATITFTNAGQSVGSVSAPIGADEIELDMVPATGIVAKAYWIRAGKSLGPMTVPAGATGALFQTTSGAAPAALIRPRVGTEFHVKWTSGGTITSAWWTRVGKLLAQIPVTAGETSIAMTQGP